MLRKATSNSAGFFGSNDVNPRYIICTTGECAKIFDMQALGLAIGYHFVLIAPQGVNERTLTHERAHIDLHAMMGPVDIVKPRFPHWFDEGLASHIAGDNRFARPNNPRTADWVRSARSWSDWSTLVKTRGVAETYGAAARLVDEIATRAGRGGLRRMIQRVADGADFTEEYEAIVGR